MISSYLAEALLDHVFGDTAYTTPSTVYVGLFLVMPDADGVGGTEVATASYARVAVTNDGTNWAVAASRQKLNDTDVTFAQAAEDWGSVVGAGIFDDPTAGNLMVFDDFDSPIDVFTNGIVSFIPGQIAITVTN